MKSKINIIVFLSIIVFTCQKATENVTNCKTKTDIEIFEQLNSRKVKISAEQNFVYPNVVVITAQLPIILDLVDFKNIDLLQQISDEKINRIKEEIKNYYLKNCVINNENYLYTINDVYLKTIQINNTSNYILYWIIFRHTSGTVNSKILFFNNSKKEFSDYVHNFNIHGMYAEKGGQLISTNLKVLLKIDFPEIEIIDFDNDELIDFRLRRLYHNGTANAIEEMIIEVNKINADTLKFERHWIRN